MIVNVDNLVKRYNDYTALDGLNFDVREGHLIRSYSMGIKTEISP